MKSPKLHTEFICVTETTPEKLAKAIEEAVEAHWDLQGSPFTAGKLCCQMMRRSAYKVEEPDHG